MRAHIYNQLVEMPRYQLIELGGYIDYLPDTVSGLKTHVDDIVFENPPQMDKYPYNDLWVNLLGLLEIPIRYVCSHELSAWIKAILNGQWNYHYYRYYKE